MVLDECLGFIAFSCFEGPGPFPGILDLWGGGGKLVEYRAALLASHGFSSLALDYLTLKNTLKTGEMVDIDYFEVNPKLTYCKYTERQSVSLLIIK